MTSRRRSKRKNQLLECVLCLVLGSFLICAGLMILLTTFQPAEKARKNIYSSDPVFVAEPAYFSTVNTND